jgi:ribosomal protein S18 acetylase RimI-like enzyme
LNAFSPQFRQATIADAAIVAAIAERTFRSTFAAQNSAEDIDSLCASAYGEAIQKEELSDPTRETWLLELDAAAIGYFMLRSVDPPACVTGMHPIEIQRFYLDRHVQGGGSGRRMMSFALERCIALRSSTVWLGVWERNPRAIQFYQKAGFSVVGSHIFTVGTDAQTDLILQLST